jgi:hypothetical protein
MSQYKPLLLTLFVIFLSITAVKSSTSQLPYSAWMLESIISRQQGLVNSGAPTGEVELSVFQSALRQAIESSNPADQSNVQKWTLYLDQSLLGSTPSLLNASRDAYYLLDRLSIGNSLLYRFSRNESNQRLPLPPSRLYARLPTTRPVTTWAASSTTCTRNSRTTTACTRYPRGTYTTPCSWSPATSLPSSQMS